MSDLLLWKNAPAFPLRTGRNAMKQQFCNLADPVFGIVQCSYEFLISFKVSPVVPLQIAKK
jgi:hypothetical protein